MTLPFEGAIKHWKFVLPFIVASLAFQAIEYYYQLNLLGAQQISLVVVRSLGFTGATFLSAALLCSIIFKFRPKLAQYWFVRRSFGVMGFLFIAMHFFNVVQLYYFGNPSALFFSLNPLQNPMIWGLMAYPFFFVMAITSFDYVVDKLGELNWKKLHRIVYVGYMFAVLHFFTINPPVFWTLAGYLLALLTVLVLAGELYWFYQTVKKKQFKSLGTYIGIAVILLWLALLYYVFWMKR